MNHKKTELEKTETLVTPQPKTACSVEKERKSIIPKMVLVALASFVVAFVMSDNIHESQRGALKAKEYEDPAVKRYRAELEVSRMDSERWVENAKRRLDAIMIEKRKGYIDDLNVWTKDIADNMPDTEASKAFGKAGLAALEDGTITDKEYNDLSNKYNELVKINKATDLEKNLNSLTQ